MEHNNTQAVRSSKMAWVSLILSCAGWLFSEVGAILGVVCGHIAMKKLKANPAMTGRGIAKAGLIVGYSCVGFHALLFLGAALLIIFIPLTKPDPVFPQPVPQIQENTIQTNE